MRLMRWGKGTLGNPSHPMRHRPSFRRFEGARMRGAGQRANPKRENSTGAGRKTHRPSKDARTRRHATTVEAAAWARGARRSGARAASTPEAKETLEKASAKFPHAADMRIFGHGTAFWHGMRRFPTEKDDRSQRKPRSAESTGQTRRRNVPNLCQNAVPWPQSGDSAARSLARERKGHARALLDAAGSDVKPTRSAFRQAQAPERPVPTLPTPPAPAVPRIHPPPKPRHAKTRALAATAWRGPTQAEGPTTATRPESRSRRAQTRPSAKRPANRIDGPRAREILANPRATSGAQTARSRPGSRRAAGAKP